VIAGACGGFWSVNRSFITFVQQCLATHPTHPHMLPSTHVAASFSNGYPHFHPAPFSNCRQTAGPSAGQNRPFEFLTPHLRQMSPPSTLSSNPEPGEPVPPAIDQRFNPQAWSTSKPPSPRHRNHLDWSRPPRQPLRQHFAAVHLLDSTCSTARHLKNPLPSARRRLRRQPQGSLRTS